MKKLQELVARYRLHWFLAGGTLAAACNLGWTEHEEYESARSVTYALVTHALGPQAQTPAQTRYVECYADSFARIAADEDRWERWAYPLATLFKSEAETEEYMLDRVNAAYAKADMAGRQCAHDHLSRPALMV